MEMTSLKVCIATKRSAPEQHELMGRVLAYFLFLTRVLSLFHKPISEIYCSIFLYFTLQNVGNTSQ